ncbi:MAG: TIGR02584 family CRISPR-associated protein, partial [Thiomargarita sp.]|nr:TIGR02584 family CRISPR-associated protein [Thiomargarita sp.]
MNKTHILFSVAGMSPAIITETLFGLYQKDIKSGEVHLLTTVQGHQSMQVLFKQIPLFNEMYHTLWHIQSDWIEILQNGQQQALHDLRTFSDNEHAANTIIERIRDWTQQDNIILHASIAGGRKTMGIYVAQA